jgi:ribosome maturation protein SDO1
MSQTTAKIRKGKEHFEVLVDMDTALNFKKGKTTYFALEIDRVFTDAKKGDVASKNELEIAFGTSDPVEVGKLIVKQGDISIDQDHRDEEREKRVKQVVDFLTKNAIDPQSNRPHSPERIKNALEQAKVVIKNTPIENQLAAILEQLNTILPIKVETKRIRITVPAIQTGKVYGLLAQYLEKENWLNDGSLEVIVAIPAGLIMEFYDKLNSMTHGSALTAEIKE